MNMWGYDDSSDPRVQCRECGLVYDCGRYDDCPRCCPCLDSCAMCARKTKLVAVETNDDGEAVCLCGEECHEDYLRDRDWMRSQRGDGQAPATSETPASARDRIPTPAEGTPISMAALVFGDGAGL
jgi:hypothetical protein